MALGLRVLVFGRFSGCRVRSFVVLLFRFLVFSLGRVQGVGY